MRTRKAFKFPLFCPFVPLFFASLALVANQGHAAQDKSSQEQLPEELKGAKIYQLPESDSARTKENMVVMKSMGYHDLGFDHLSLSLFLSVRPVDRDATIRRIYFQDMSANGFPLHIATFESEFKVSKKDTIDLPQPLICTLVFSDLDSLQPLRELVAQDKLHLTGKSFVEVKLNGIEKLALRTKQLVVPVDVNQDVPLQMFSGNPILQAAATNILDTLDNPYSMQALAIAKEHVERLAEHQHLTALANSSLYFVYTTYGLRDPETRMVETHTESGTAFVVGNDGKLVTTKSVIQPWKFDPQAAFLMSQRHFDLDSKSYNVVVWPAGGQIRGAEGEVATDEVTSTANGNLKVQKMPTDVMERVDYVEGDSGKSISVEIHSATENNLVVLQASGSSFQPLTLNSAAVTGPAQNVTLLSFPFCLNQQLAIPQVIPVRLHVDSAGSRLDNSLNPGELGAPLVNSAGSVLGIAAGGRDVIPIDKVRKLLP
jgi:Trypsin-like peptidase domain